MKPCLPAVIGQVDTAIVSENEAVAVVGIDPKLMVVEV
jgi:hypothetical protein